MECVNKKWVVQDMKTHKNKWVTKWEKMGAYYGYPKCCIEDFCTNNGVLTQVQEKVHQHKGFVPCTKCAKKILKGEVTLEGLITNRECKIEFK